MQCFVVQHFGSPHGLPSNGSLSPYCPSVSTASRTEIPAARAAQSRVADERIRPPGCRLRESREAEAGPGGARKGRFMEEKSRHPVVGSQRIWLDFCSAIPAGSAHDPSRDRSRLRCPPARSLCRLSRMSEAARYRSGAPAGQGFGGSACSEAPVAMHTVFETPGSTGAGTSNDCGAATPRRIGALKV